MTQLVRASTSWPGREDVAHRESLAPQMVEAAVTRLRWISLLCAVLGTFLVFLARWLQPDTSGLVNNPVLSLVWLFVVLISLGISAVQRFRLFSPLAVLNLGLVFEVVVAAAISYSETAVPLSPDRPVLGISRVALWIIAVGLLIPNKPWIKFVTALASASTWPLAYFLSLHIYGYQPLPINHLLMWIHMPYIMALVTYGISKRVYMMETAVQKARDLGSYHMVSLIGTGGMGQVWRARHRMLARDAAIKVIRADLMMDQPGYQAEITRRRFAREAQAIASLQCPHTVYLFDFGVSQDGSFYYVMELLDGISLEMLIDKFGPQPAERVVRMLRQVCESLEEAHEQGLIHRDIKPSNIFSCMVGIEYDFMKVLDFGLAKNILQKDELHLTMVGTAAGTPAYMAPEVAMGEGPIDGRVDLYSLGCVAYFLLTGSPVFDEKTPTAAAMAHVQKVPVPPSQRSEMPIPTELEQIVLKCLAKKPEDRPQSAAELNRLLASIDSLPEWSQKRAEEWWQTYLPVSSSYRMARQPRPVAASSEQEAAIWSTQN